MANESTQNCSLCRIVLAITALKLLLIPSYRSTDFEVHRNWMAITYELPLKEWYVDATSPWTLDYPPLFAWFEYLLARLAAFFDPGMLVVNNLNYASDATIIFQRLTVIMSDAVLIGATWCSATRSKMHPKERLAFFALVVGNAGLLMVDHIHFQYNGMLLGVLIWSIVAIEQDHCVLSAVLFAVLLNLKHLFVYSAAVFFGYLLRHKCLHSGTLRWGALCKLAVSVLSVLGLSFGPFLVDGQLSQILSRLFPFGRGLCHAYWAPNAWAVYAFADKILAFAWKLFRPAASFSEANMTGGLVGQWSFSILPDVPPFVTLLLTLVFASIPSFLLICKPHKDYFMECVAYANLCGFVWGYHVHEKAILTVLIPLIFVAFRGGPMLFPRHRDHFLFLSTVMHYSLTPLLYTNQEYPIKILLLISYALLVAMTAQQVTSGDNVKTPCRLVCWSKSALSSSLLILEIWKLLTSITGVSTSSLEFLPLMLTSVLCSSGICTYWAVWTLHIVWAFFDTKIKVL